MTGSRAKSSFRNIFWEYIDIKIAGNNKIPSLKPPKSPNAAMNEYTSLSYVFSMSASEMSAGVSSNSSPGNNNFIRSAPYVSLFSMLKNVTGSESY